ncbi:MAG: hypothetical protein RJB38_1701 [Pseudomonadota bacterium]|jgi:type IV pilus assembly protein PilO
MDATALLSRLRSLVPLVGLVFGGYQAYDYYVVFQQDEASPLAMKRNELQALEKQNKTLEKKLKDLEEFVKKLDAKKQEMQSIVDQLAQTKDSISNEVQMPDFVKLIVSEAKRTGLTVTAITPAKKVQQEYYIEYPVDLKFKGVFAQAYSFVSRLASLQRIVRIDKFDLKPLANASGKFIELEGALELKTFSYVGSKADQIGKEAQ